MLGHGEGAQGREPGRRDSKGWMAYSASSQVARGQGVWCEAQGLRLWRTSHITLSTQILVLKHQHMGVEEEASVATAVMSSRQWSHEDRDTQYHIQWWDKQEEWFVFKCTFNFSLLSAVFLNFTGSRKRGFFFFVPKV